jgi:hypothetical protein
MSATFPNGNRDRTERTAFRRYAELCAIEPRLADLLVEMMRRQPTTWAWYRDIKPRIESLVGWSAESRELRTCEAYDIVYRALYSWCFDPPAERST